jgi:hypothetical protein
MNKSQICGNGWDKRGKKEKSYFFFYNASFPACLKLTQLFVRQSAAGHFKQLSPVNNRAGWALLHPVGYKCNYSELVLPDIFQIQLLIP